MCVRVVYKFLPYFGGHTVSTDCLYFSFLYGEKNIRVTFFKWTTEFMLKTPERHSPVKWKPNTALTEEMCWAERPVENVSQTCLLNLYLQPIWERLHSSQGEGQAIKNKRLDVLSLHSYWLTKRNKEWHPFIYSFICSFLPNRHCCCITLVYLTASETHSHFLLRFLLLWFLTSAAGRAPRKTTRIVWAAAFRKTVISPVIQLCRYITHVSKYQFNLKQKKT